MEDGDSDADADDTLASLKKIYVDEAKHVAHDISARLSHVTARFRLPLVTLRSPSRGRQMTAACSSSLSRTLNGAACQWQCCL